MSTHEVTRRELLRKGAAAGAGLAAMQFLAACGINGGASTTTTTGGGATTTLLGGSSTTVGTGERRAATVSFATADPLKVQHMRNRALEFQNARTDLDLRIEIPGEIPDAGATYINSLIAGDPFANTVDFNMNTEWPQVLAGDIYSEYLVDLTDVIAPFEDRMAFASPYKVNGRIYGFPDVLGAAVFYFREDIFSAAGIDPVFDTWEDLIEAGLKLKTDTGAMILPIDASGFNHYQPLALMAGGGWFDENQQVVLDNAENAQALQLMHDLVNVHEVAYLTTEFYGAGVWQAYRDGTIVGAFMPDWYGAFQMPGNLDGMRGLWKMTAAPKFAPDGFTSAVRGGGVQTVLAGDDQDVQIEFMLHAQLEPESNIRRTLETNYYPIMPEAYEDPRIVEHVSTFLQQPVASVLSGVIGNMAPFWTSPYLLQAQDLLATAVVPAGVSGERPVEEILGDAAGQLRQAAGQ